MTAEDLYDQLSRRYAAPEYALIPQAAERTGGSRGWLDAVAISLWPSRGIWFHGLEIKCARYDWKRELAKPEKADLLFRHLDYFSIVAADDTIVEDGELPPTWGLIVYDAEKNTLRQKVTAPRLHEGEIPTTMGRQFLAAICRRIDENYVRGRVEKESRGLRAAAEKEAEERLRRRVAVTREDTDALVLAAFADGMGYTGRITDEAHAREMGQILVRLSGLVGEKRYSTFDNLLRLMNETTKEIKALRAMPFVRPVHELAEKS